MAFLKVRPKKGKRSFKNENNEGYVDERLFNIALNNGLATQVYKYPSFAEPLETYFADDLEVIG